MGPRSRFVSLWYPPNNRSYPMFEVQIFVPMWDNDGKSFPQETFDDFEDKAREWFKGFTRCPNVLGSWVNDAGKVFDDCSRVYVVACKGLQDAHEARILA